MRVLRRVCRFNVYDVISLCALLIKCCCYSSVILLYLSKLQCGIYSTPSTTPFHSWIHHCQTMQEGVNMGAHKSLSLLFCLTAASFFIIFSRLCKASLTLFFCLTVAMYLLKFDNPCNASLVLLCWLIDATSSTIGPTYPKVVRRALTNAYMPILCAARGMIILGVRARKVSPWDMMCLFLSIFYI